MFYHKVNQDLTTTTALGKVTLTFVGASAIADAVNLSDTGNSRVQESKVVLDLASDGIYQLKLTKNVTKIEVSGDIANILVFSKLRIAKDINSKLDYRLAASYNTGITRIDKLITDIKDKAIAGDFYYSVPVDTNRDIDLNPLVETEKLSSPEIWYDHNNENNKFVISELDSDYLITGITLTKSSRS